MAGGASIVCTFLGANSAMVEWDQPESGYCQIGNNQSIYIL